MTMNANATINLTKLNEVKFNHIHTYTLLFYILHYYDTEINKVRIDKNDLVNKHGYTYRSIRLAISELVDNHFIAKSKYSSYWYKVNQNIFVEFHKRK